MRAPGPTQEGPVPGCPRCGSAHSRGLSVFLVAATFQRGRQLSRTFLLPCCSFPTPLPHASPGALGTNSGEGRRLRPLIGPLTSSLKVGVGGAFLLSHQKGGTADELRGARTRREEGKVRIQVSGVSGPGRSPATHLHQARPLAGSGHRRWASPACLAASGGPPRPPLQPGPPASRAAWGSAVSL